MAQHVSSDTPLIIRSSKTLIAASGFTYVCGCRQLLWLSGNGPLIIRSSKTLIAASGFTYVCGCRQLLWLSGNGPLIIRSSKTLIAASGFTYVCGCRQLTYVIPEAAITVFELLMMSSVLLETCWAIKKHLNNKFYYSVASCWLFL
jgi:hypothetical protein